MRGLKIKILELNLSSALGYLLSVIYLLSSSFLGFAQTKKSDLIVLPEPPFSYYEIIEERNFFRPRKDDDAKPEEYRSLLIGAGQDSRGALKHRGPAAAGRDDAGINDSLGLILTGVIEIQNGYKAIVEKKNQTAGYYVSVNDPIEDYIVKDIQRDKIVLEKDAALYELKLERAAKLPDGVLNAAPVDTAADETTGSAEYKEDIRLNRMKNLRMGIGGPQ